MNSQSTGSVIKRLAIKTLILAAAFWTSYILWSIWLDSAEVALPDHDYLQEIQELRAAGRIGEAAALARAVSALPGMPHGEEIKALAVELEKEYGGWSRRAKDVLEGAITGKAESPESFAGAIITDFLFIGDIRDLAIQGGKKIRGEDADELIMLLSGVGLLASAATWVPEPTSTAAGLTAHPILTVFKGLKKIGALTERFSGVLREVFSKVAKSKEWRHASALLTDMGGLMRRAPAGTVPAIMRHVDSAEDLGAVSRWCARSPERTVAALHVGGKDALEWLKAAGTSADEQLGILLRKGAKAFAGSRKWVRGGKAVYRGRLEDLRSAGTDLAMRHPKFRKGVFGLACITSLLGIVFAIDLIIALRAMVPRKTTAAAAVSMGAK